ncbi:lipid-A-disaccharide synthase [Hydromonas duriensis]|uniref:Lipid-A-disaccharide synthase n=1 Tax=Hydromonas duriensis TaxID=1527608 RepID=A0A4R6Y8G0_9BURK|nr:lipid-A-disaccharide synthase [Hydromonas duriensis]TDR31677.1 lipid-A-disaccharide synthase [Hydromonas duriensis]
MNVDAQFQSLSLALVAGESSGDQLGAELVKGARATFLETSAVGIAGDAMVREGVQAWWPSQSLAVRGYFEPIRHLPRIIGMRNDLIKRLTIIQPDVFVGIDAPDFNLGVETKLRAAGVKTMHYVSPSIWAWRPKRIEKIRRAANHVLLIFPFEQKIYQDAGIPATYVGHPFASHIPLTADTLAARTALQISAEGLVIALLPGSRHSEIDYNLPGFFQAAQQLTRVLGDVQFILPIAHAALRDKVQTMRAQYAPNIALRLFDGQARNVMEAADATLVASGTASLEVALYKKPMVISYKTSRLSAAIYPKVALLPWIGLPNILLNESFIPEVLQDDATPKGLADALLAQMNRYASDTSVSERLMALHHSLIADTPSLCAQAIAQVLEYSQ